MGVGRFFRSGWFPYSPPFYLKGVDMFDKRHPTKHIYVCDGWNHDHDGHDDNMDIDNEMMLKMTPDEIGVVSGTIHTSQQAVDAGEAEEIPVAVMLMVGTKPYDKTRAYILSRQDAMNVAEGLISFALRTSDIEIQMIDELLSKAKGVIDD